MTTDTAAPAPIPAAEPIAAPVLRPTYYLDKIAPRQTGDLNLSDAERAALVQAARSGDLRGAWAKIHSDREAAATAENAVLLAREAAEQAQAAQQPADGADPGYISPELLSERTNGALSAPMIDALEGIGNLASARFEHTFATGGAEGFAAAVAAGEAEILEREFRGDQSAFEHAANDIGRVVAIIDPSGQLGQALTESGVVADPTVFTRLRLYAANVLNKVGRS